MSAITSKGQATIPKPIREYLALKPGDEVEFLIVGDRVELKRAEKARIYELGKENFGKWSSGHGALSEREQRKSVFDDAMRAKHD